jgi:uncharacterized protein YuzE
MMKIEYDTDHDLLNIEFLADAPIHDSLEVDGIVIDYAKDKRIVAIEVLDASKRTTRNPRELENLTVVGEKPGQPDRVRERGGEYRKKRKTG